MKSLFQTTQMPRLPGVLVFIICLVTNPLVAEEQFVLNGSPHVNCHDDTTAPIGEECAKSPIISSDWKISLKLDTGAETKLLLGKEPPLNHTIAPIAPGDYPSLASGRFFELEVAKRPESTEDDCFVLGDVWLHALGQDGKGACRFLLHKREQGETCNPNGIARFATQIADLPEQCGNSALQAEIDGLPRTQFFKKLIDVEVGEKHTLTLKLNTEFPASDGYSVAGCFPKTLPFYDDIDETFPFVAKALPQTNKLQQSNSFLNCDEGFTFENGANGESTLLYEAVAQIPGVARFYNISPISGRFRLSNMVFEPVAERPLDEALRITGGLKLLVDAPDLVEKKGKTFSTTLTLTNNGKGTATITGRSCTDFIAGGYDNIIQKGSSGYEQDFDIPGGQSVKVKCTYEIINEGNVDFTYNTFWTHQSGGEVYSPFTCTDQPKSRSRCLKASVATGENDIVRVHISKEDAECGDGVIDGNEDCDGGPCCTDDCTFVERGEPCRGQSVCATGDGLCFGDRPYCPGEKETDGISSVSFSLDEPVGPSSYVFTSGWLLGVNAQAKCKNGNTRDVSSQVSWSGTGSFAPTKGSRSRPIFSGPGSNKITFSFESFKKDVQVSAVLPSGYAAVGDEAYAPVDDHSSPGGPFEVRGQITSGSGLVSIGGVPAAYVGSSGVHAACAGPNQFVVSAGDPQVRMHGRAAARLGDATTHCGGPGTIVDVASDNGAALRSLKSSLSEGLITALSNTGSISGTVTSTATGDPIESLSILAVSEDGAVFPAWTNASGEYAITSLPAGDYHIICNGREAGFVELTLEDVVTVETSNVDNVDCSLLEGAQISGSVQILSNSTSATPAEGVWVHATNIENESESVSKMTGEDGSYELSGLSPGSYRVLASGSSIGYADTYYPAEMLWDNARTVSAQSARTTAGIIITLSKTAPEDICDTVSSYADRSALEESISKQLSFNRRALKVLSKAAKQRRKKVQKQTKKLRKQALSSSDKSLLATGNLPTVYYSNCDEAPLCSAVSLVESKKQLLQDMKKFFVNMKRIERLNKKVTGGRSNAISTLKRKSGKLLRGTRKRLESMPVDTLSCEN